MKPFLRSVRLAAVVAAFAAALGAPSGARAQVLLEHFTGTYPGSYVESTGPAERWAKPFTPTASGLITDVQLWAQGVWGVGTGSFTIEIRTASGGNPGALLGSGTGSVDPSLGSGQATVPISGPVSLIAGTTYYAVFYASAGNWTNWLHSATATEGVRASTDGGGSWSAAAGADARRASLRINGRPPASPNGASCTAGSQCTSAFCVDGVCCGSACSGGAGDCQACSTAAGGTSNGACTPLAAAVAATVPCRAAAGGCDVPETCSSSSTVCPPNTFVATGTTCREAAGECDVAETCNGTASCPSDSLATAAVVCRPSSGACDAPETCSGISVGCPSDALAADGTSCADGMTCNGVELCVGGACMPASSLSCDDGDACTADSCAEPGGCAHDVIAECCNADEDCLPTGACMASTCDVATHTCTSAPIDGCCADDADCDDADECTTDTCDLTTCTSAVISGCGDPDGGADDDAGVRGDAAISADAGGETPPESAGCACAIPGARHDRSSPAAMLLAIGAVLALRSRRRPL